MLEKLAAAEKKVFSQNGEDGVIEAIFAAIGVTNRFFVEFGVEDATECNAAYLLEQGWTGLLMDGTGISRNPLAVVQREMVTAENVNELFAKYHVSPEFDLLSIDIDGNDYWVWKALDYRPRVVVIEYNAGVPPELRRVIPYDPHFQWDGSDYMGASLGALAELGNRKGYELVYCERAGSNAFFLARSELPADYSLRPLAEIYRPPNYFYQGLRHRPDPYRALLDPEEQGLFDRARRAHQTGDLRQAERLYREVLQADPRHADAQHLLGYLEYQAGHAEAALPLLRGAIAVNPPAAVYHSTLGRALQELGQLAQAVACFQRALQLDPNHVDALKHLGLVYKDQGLLAEAAACFRQVLRHYPTEVDAHNNLGNVLKNLGQLAEAVACYREALRLMPNHANAHNNLGIVFAIQGQPDAAVACFRQALLLNPEFVDALTNLGLVFKQQGQLEEAVARFRQALRLAPHHANALHNLGLVLKEQGHLAEAAKCFQEIRRLHPNHSGAHHNLGNVLQEQGHLAEAAQCYRRALQLNPQLGDAYNSLGIVCKDQGQLAEAAECFRQVLPRNPDDAGAHNNLGNVLKNQGQLLEAVQCFRQALSINPHYAKAHNNLGIVLSSQGQLTEAVACFQRALQIDPGDVNARYNLGIAYKDLGQLDEAADYYEQTLRLVPQHANARWNRSHLLLLRGDYQRGWPEYESRWTQPDHVQRHLDRPRWDGSPLQGKTILLYYEQGFGDTLQFIRYAPLVKRLGGRVLFECQPALLGLLERMVGIDQLVAVGSSLPPFDYQVPLLSLPGLFQTTLATIPADIPYLQISPELVRSWGKKLQRLDGFKVGIVWQGNPKFASDRKRSFPLAHFEPLSRVKGVVLVSLQKGPGTAQLRASAGRAAILDLGEQLEDFTDTAAVMKNLDLIVSSDTSVPHLAGALGVHVWTVLQLMPDWRWLLGREDSPWYPTMRLFRQNRRGDWAEVMDHVAAALRCVMESRTAS